MRRRHAFTFSAVVLVFAVIASACGGIDSAGDRISGYFGESTSDRLESRIDSTVARLTDRGASDLDVRATETVTLQQLQEAGIPVGSNTIACNEPLDLVLVEGIFDSDDIFATGVSLAGGTFEGVAMRLVAEIYDPDEDMPLGMIGGQDGGQLTGISQDSSVASGQIDGSLMLGGGEEYQDDALIPESTCQ